MKLAHAHRISTGAALALLAVLSLSSAAEAQTPRYRVIDITPIRFVPNIDQHGNVQDLLLVIAGWGACADPIDLENMMMQGGSPAETLLEVLLSIPEIPEEIIEAVEAIINNEL